MSDQTIPSIARSRARLVELLSEAAELEHGLCCQYLFAAFSLKARPYERHVTPLQLEMIRDWKTDLLLLSREEMLHLNLVCNLLTAVGAVPYFSRPNFPQPSRLYPIEVRSTLEPVSVETLERFIRFEQPELSEDDPQAASPGRPPRSVGALYKEIRKYFEAEDSERLFLVGASKQIDTAAVVDPGGFFDDEVRVGYGVEPFPITGRSSALKALDLIIEQGEGSSHHREEAHVMRLRRMLQELVSEQERCQRSGIRFEPARPVLHNPVSRPAHDSEGTNLITHPDALEATELFNAAYQLMMLMLIRFFARKDESFREFEALQQTIFFPLMTMVLRPLGELLTMLPASREGGESTAGPSFEFTRPLQFIPDKHVAWSIFKERLDDLAERGRRLCGLKMENPEVGARLRFLAENLERISSNLHRIEVEGSP